MKTAHSMQQSPANADVKLHLCLKHMASLSPVDNNASLLSNYGLPVGPERDRRSQSPLPPGHEAWSTDMSGVCSGQWKTHGQRRQKALAGVWLQHGSGGPEMQLSSGVRTEYAADKPMIGLTGIQIGTGLDTSTGATPDWCSLMSAVAQ